MNKLTIQNKIWKTLALGLGMLGLVLVVQAYSGSAQNVTENGDINVINGVESPAQLQEMAGMLGAAVAGDASHLSQEPKPTALSNLFLSGDLEVDGTAYFDGTTSLAAISMSGNLVVDTDTLYADATNDKVMFNTTTASGYSFMVAATGTGNPLLGVLTSNKAVVADTDTLYVDTVNDKVMFNTTTASGYSFMVAATGTGNPLLSVTNGTDYTVGVNNSLVVYDDLWLYDGNTTVLYADRGERNVSINTSTVGYTLLVASSTGAIYMTVGEEGDLTVGTGTEFTVDVSANAVGINTTTPNAELDVFDATATTSIRALSSGSKGTCHADSIVGGATIYWYWTGTGTIATTTVSCL